MADNAVVLVMTDTNKEPERIIKENENKPDVLGGDEVVESIPDCATLPEPDQAEPVAIDTISALVASSREGSRRQSDNEKPSKELPKDMDYNHEVLSTLTRLGEGGYGDVYLDKRHETPIVVKIFKDMPAAVAKFYQEEVEALKRQTHDNIVQFFGTIVENGRLTGIKMEHCEQGNLKKLILDKKFVYSIGSFHNWTRQLMGALNHLFRRHKIIHRDIKPENILVTKDFTLKIGDFGTVRARVEQTCVTTMMIGTPRYLPPQLSNGESHVKVSHRDDVYACGLVMWEILERKLVFSEYENDGHFVRDRFEAEVKSGKLKGLAPPTCCVTQLRDIVIRCVTFDHTVRPDAWDIIDLMLKFEDQLHLVDFAPHYDPNASQLLRPIGFDNSKNRTPIETTFDQLAYLLPPSINTITIDKGPIIEEIAPKLHRNNSLPSSFLPRSPRPKQKIQELKREPSPEPIIISLEEKPTPEPIADHDKQIVLFADPERDLQFVRPSIFRASTQQGARNSIRVRVQLPHYCKIQESHWLRWRLYHKLLIITCLVLLIIADGTFSPIANLPYITNHTSHTDALELLSDINFFADLVIYPLQIVLSFFAILSILYKKRRLLLISSIVMLAMSVLWLPHLCFYLIKGKGPDAAMAGFVIVWCAILLLLSLLHLHYMKHCIKCY